MSTTPRVIFIAGATGATGQRVVKLATARRDAVIPHARSSSASKLTHPDLVTGELSSPTIFAAIERSTTVVQLIGTMRKRFASGDTYETSDIGTTRTLVEAATRAKSVDHIVLLSSVGAGQPRGAYLKAKAEAERLVVESKIPYTIFRPSMFEDREGSAVPGVRLVTKVLGLTKYQPISMHELASGILHAAVMRAPLNTVLEGNALWSVVNAALATMPKPQ